MLRRMPAIALAILGALGMTSLVAANDKPQASTPPVFLAVHGASLVSAEMEASQDGSTYTSRILANLSIVDLPDPISVAIQLTIVDGPDPFGYALMTIVDEPDPLGIIDVPDPISLSLVATVVDEPDPFGISVQLRVGR